MKARVIGLISFTRNQRALLAKHLPDTFIRDLERACSIGMVSVANPETLGAQRSGLVKLADALTLASEILQSMPGLRAHLFAELDPVERIRLLELESVLEIFSEDARTAAWRLRERPQSRRRGYQFQITAIVEVLAAAGIRLSRGKGSRCRVICDIAFAAMGLNISSEAALKAYMENLTIDQDSDRQ